MKRDDDAVSPKGRYWKPISQVCSELHMQVRGMSDVLNDAQILRRLDFLRIRLATWKEEAGVHAVYDECYRDLMKASLNEYADREEVASEPRAPDCARCKDSGEESGVIGGIPWRMPCRVCYPPLTVVQIPEVGDGGDHVEP